MDPIRKPTKAEKKQIRKLWQKSWRIKVRQLLPEEGGDWIASIPQFGDWTFTGCGTTPTKAIKSLKHCFFAVCTLWLDESNEEAFRLLTAEPVDEWIVSKPAPSDLSLEEVFTEATAIAKPEGE